MRLAVDGSGQGQGRLGDRAQEEAEAWGQQRLEALQRELDQVAQKKATIERHLQPALDALLSEYSAVQQEAARVGLRAPSTTPHRTPYRGQVPTGYGQ